jgi:hypothetical protein
MPNEVQLFSLSRQSDDFYNFWVQFGCKQDGQDGNYGFSGLIFPSNMDTMDTICPLGQYKQDQ